MNRGLAAIAASERLDHARRSCAAGDSVHAMAIALDGGSTPSQLETVLRQRIGQLPLGGDAARCRVWLEEVPADRSSDRAAAWRARELQRPLHTAGGLLLRAALAQYRDGRELVLVAHRALLGRSALAALAAELCGGPPADLACQRAPQDPPDGLDEEVRASFHPLSLDWCTRRTTGGEQVGVEFELGLAPGDQRAVAGTVLGALAIALARYENRAELVIGALTSDGLAAPEGIALVPITVDEECGAREFAAAAGAALIRFGCCWHGRQLSRDLAGADGGLATVALHLDTAIEPGWYEPGRLADFPVTVHVTRDRTRPELLLGAIRCAGERFDPGMVRQFGAHVAAAFTALVSAADRPIGELSLLGADEAEAVARLGDGGPLAPARWPTIHEAVAAQAASRPDAIAVSYQDEELSYRELEERGEQVSAALRAKGIGTGARVGVCLPRSAELIAVLLGILKAGAAYVPMDPDHPAERLRYTAADAELSAVVAADPFPATGDLPVFGTAELSGRTDTGSPGATRDDPAYLIYTSGSTGRPKGVVVPHRNVVSLVEATRRDLGLGPADTWTQFHSVAFDFSVWEIWGCLMTGGRLVVVPPLVARAPEEFLGLLRRTGVTVLNQTPTAFGQLLTCPRLLGELAVRLVVFGGETLNTKVLTTWLDHRPEQVCRLVNMFGITETTVHVTAEHLDRRSAIEGSRAVGGALPGWSVRVRDARGRLLPPGVRGEIWVGGAGVALGYFNQPGLTEQRFHTDPVSGARWYRSGDLGRLLPDGRLEHLGRLDDQVSVRGHRVETGEITAVLLEDPVVTAAAVTTEHDVDAGTLLHVFVVAPEGTDPLAVRRRAAQRLPQYMLPTTISCVPQLPLTANGKLDLAALSPRPGTVQVVRQEPRLADPVERICQVWSELLGMATGPSDDFFELGGNSLLATKLSLVLQEAGFPALPVRQLYRRSTPLGVAGYYEQLDPGQSADAEQKGATDQC
ncbi:non-ribosomal peptide synthetase [Kutzneria albida]|uniref:Non-ribosomal peptide synthetase n=1 Tax=Kutzneria albida DSM 43870 TaxID=1449976 RepID=W5W3Z0_9PSEU|nr:non-ribosomal peptide synthetase [Kutzneria albida]AHH95953.1 non-ribosomal peptide synthetase [Kutzneria albida DSM 43870]